MKRNLIYSALVFVLMFCWIAVGGLTQYFLGAINGDALGPLLGFALVAGIFLSGIFFVVFRVIRGKFISGAAEVAYAPSAKFIVVAAALLAVTVIGSVAQSYSVGKAQLEAKRQEDQKTEDAAKLVAERKAKEEQRLAAMTPEQRDAEVKQKEDAVNSKIIEEGEVMLKRRIEIDAYGSALLSGKKVKDPGTELFTKKEWDDLITRLNSIKQGQTHYQKAQKLLVALADAEKKSAAISAVYEAKLRVEKRKEFAEKLEKIFIDKRMDTDVTVSGPKNTILNIKWALANKVTANDLAKTDILNTAEDAGFKKVVFTDGFDFSLGWTLTPKVE